MSHPIEEMRKLTDEELIKEHDEKAKHTVVGTQYYLDELDRRSRDRSQEAVYQLSLKTQKLAERTYWQSWVSVAASIIALAISVASIIL